LFDTFLDSVPLIFDPYRLGLVVVGVLIGTVIGILPGLGGTVGMAVLLPFVFGMDPYAGVALLIGMKVVTNTADTFPAVLLGVPGSGGVQATILDGYPMARKGQAGRALGAAFTSSLLGGLIGATFLLALLPVARPIVMAMASPELFMLTFLGLTMVAILSQGSMLTGLLAALLGVMIGFVGAAPNAPIYRYTYETLYLYEGFSIVVVALGLFAVPEIVQLLAAGKSISKVPPAGLTGQRQGMLDALRNKWLILRSSMIGAASGLIPGFGGGAADWMVYGLAKQTSKGGRETFGKGDVRGVIAPDAANNSKDGADLVPTLLFGIPGGASMALFLVGLISFGIQPGPSMLDPERNLDVTYVIIWTLAIGNIAATAICFGLARYVARLSYIPPATFMPFLIVLIVLAAYQSTREWGDLVTLVLFGVLGYVMKELDWARVPVLIGMVLGPAAEGFLVISWQQYGWTWLARPLVLVFAVVLAAILLSSFVGGRRSRKRRTAAALEEASR
jgi:putative tricarboxylic transport membrane protein